MIGKNFDRQQPQVRLLTPNIITQTFKIQNKKVKMLRDIVKSKVEPNITQLQKTTADDTYLQTYQFANEIRIQNKTNNQFPVPIKIYNM